MFCCPCSGYRVFEDAGVLNFRSAGYDAVQVVGEGRRCKPARKSQFLPRAHEPEAELPVSVHLRHFDPLTDFQDAEDQRGLAPTATPIAHRHIVAPPGSTSGMF